MASGEKPLRPLACGGSSTLGLRPFAPFHSSEPRYSDLTPGFKPVLGCVAHFLLKTLLWPVSEPGRPLVPQTGPQATGLKIGGRSGEIAGTNSVRIALAD